MMEDPNEDSSRAVQHGRLRPCHPFAGRASSVTVVFWPLPDADWAGVPGPDFNVRGVEAALGFGRASEWILLRKEAACPLPATSPRLTAVQGIGEAGSRLGLLFELGCLLIGVCASIVPFSGAGTRPREVFLALVYPGREEATTNGAADEDPSSGSRHRAGFTGLLCRSP